MRQVRVALRLHVDGALIHLAATRAVGFSRGTIGNLRCMDSPKKRISAVRNVYAADAGHTGALDSFDRRDDVLRGLTGGILQSARTLDRPSGNGDSLGRDWNSSVVVSERAVDSLEF